MNVAVRDHRYDYGALWTIVDDPDGLRADELFQCLRGTRHYLGVLPTGRRAGVGVLVRALLRHGGAWWREGCPPGGTPPARWPGRCAPLLDRVDHLLPATYRDVVVRTPYRIADLPAGEPPCSSATPRTR